MRHPSAALALAAALSLLASTQPVAAQQVALHPLLADHAVLQRDRPVRIPGTAAPGAEVVVTFGEHRARTRAGADGRWLTELPALPASRTPRELAATAGEQRAVARDVLVGEVWVCSGQSNMVWPVRRCSTPEAFAQQADLPHIREFKAPTQEAATPQETLRGAWRVCTPESVLDFSACAWHFGRRLHDTLDVPIGLVNVSWGGSSLEAWIRREVLAAHEVAADGLAAYDAYHAVAEAAPAEWAAADVDDGSWRSATLPARLAELDLGDADGTFDFRTTVDVPQRWQGRALRLSLGAIDDRDTTCFAGARVGGTGRHDRQRSYEVPARLVRPGPAVIAVRVVDNAGPGGFTGPAEAMVLHPADDPDDAISLARPWRMRVVTTEPVPARQHWPAHLFNAMTHPLRHLGPRGVIWYQGENNAIAPRGEEYYALFPAMIADWRRLFGEQDMPFLFVQLPNFGSDDDGTRWRFPVVRDAQLHTLRTVPHTGMAITIDVGEPGDIHPKNKHDVGDRLARWALVDVYGRDGIVKSGPIAAAADFPDTGPVSVAFQRFGAALATRDGGPLGGFELAGRDGVFHRATAIIVDGQRVEVQSAAVPQPQAVRYAWRNSPADANLVGGDGLPASPFRLAVE